MEPGENWAYRARAVDDLVEVKVLRLGTKKPPRVLVHFLDDHFEGREDWVPPARLKVIWSGVEEYVARERHWAAVSGAFPVADTAGEYAAGHVIEEYLDRELAGVQYGSAAGVCSIYDVAGLARFLDVDAAQLTSHPLAFSYHRPYWQLLRDWCGAEAGERQDELARTSPGSPAARTAG
jgi:hypothetical protein